MTVILPIYSVKQFFHTDTYPLDTRIKSPGWSNTPGSSQTETLTEPDLSATLHDLTS